MKNGYMYEILGSEDVDCTSEDGVERAYEAHKILSKIKDNFERPMFGINAEIRYTKRVICSEGRDCSPNPETHRTNMRKRVKPYQF